MLFVCRMVRHKQRTLWHRLPVRLFRPTRDNSDDKSRVCSTGWSLRVRLWWSDV
jgi:hypothetical protein